MDTMSREQSLRSTGFDELVKPRLLGTHKVQRNRTTSSGYIAKFLILPKEWVDFNKIKVGDEVELVMETDGTLSLKKVKDERSKD